MTERYFEPWVGPNYAEGGLLILSESTYDWLGDDGEVCTPSPQHPEGSMKWHMENFENSAYYKAMNRTLTGEERPTIETMKSAWDRVAYTPFIQGSVGFGSGVRPKPEQWKAARELLKGLLEELRPSKILVTGIDMWNRMPDTQVGISADLQAYTLDDGSLAWCLAIPHPANRAVGFNWRKYSEYLSNFRMLPLPRLQKEFISTGA